jgi:hypothetical protein
VLKVRMVPGVNKGQQENRVLKESRENKVIEETLVLVAKQEQQVPKAYKVRMVAQVPQARMDCVVKLDNRA